MTIILIETFKMHVTFKNFMIRQLKVMMINQYFVFLNKHYA